MHLNEAKRVIQAEILGLEQLIQRMGDEFNEAIHLLLKATHHVAVSGMGKAGLIGAKIAATLASTGTPSFFMHPAEAIHGDFGMLKKEDVVILLSFGGETEEINRLLPMLKVRGNPIIAITKTKTSTLGKGATIVLELGPMVEACPMGLAPTTSTTAMAALGDALAVVLLNQKNFDEKKYAFFHPGGSLGKKLLKVKEVMRTKEQCPILLETTPIKEAILKITAAQAGASILIDSEGSLAGIFTDGDLRRHLNDVSSNDTHPVKGIMTQNPKSVDLEMSALEAVGIMKQFMIGDLPVIDSTNKPVGLLNLKDLVNIGLLDL